MSQPSAREWSAPRRLLFLLPPFVFVAGGQAGLHLVDGAPYLGSLLRSFVPPLTLWCAAGLGVALTAWQVWRILGGGGPRFALLNLGALLPAMAGAAHSVLEARAF